LYQINKKSKSTKARLGRITTDHGSIDTPIFMPVGTQGTVKAVKKNQLEQDIDAEIILGNTYHLYLRPGIDIIQSVGGLHPFMNWNRPILTDSGGYQIFSLSDNRELSEEGAKFKSHLDGSQHLFTPENVVEIQRKLGSDIIMILDECPPYPCDFDYVEESMNLTYRWAKRGREAFKKSKSLYGHRQLQFGIVQGGTYKDLRKTSSEQMVSLDFEGLAIGGLSVGEPSDLMYEITDWNTDFLPAEKPRYLMGVGTPANLLQCIALGIDMFDCVMPTRNARNGMIFTREGTVNIRNAKWKQHHQLLDERFPSELCSLYNMSYIHHLFRADEILGLILASIHNLTFYLWLMRECREKIQRDEFHDWYPGMMKQLERRI
jgi:queuine tRNA-ribosyltransferase